MERAPAADRGRRRTTWFELFFDLVFVVAIAALAGFLHDDLGSRAILVPRLPTVASALALVAVGPGPLALVGLLALSSILPTVFEYRHRDGGRPAAGEVP
ncbi:hypothetical protein [Rubrobacter marinus]|uniref:hypothetical protein n=1 Tax=Rubrobacter marinus TaxID=2653852 RepID=UPI001A9F22EC|nr:hypothetical protein [Rubrobacter marinus]